MADRGELKKVVESFSGLTETQTVQGRLCAVYNCGTHTSEAGRKRTLLYLVIDVGLKYPVGTWLALGWNHKDHPLHHLLKDSTPQEAVCKMIDYELQCVIGDDENGFLELKEVVLTETPNEGDIQVYPLEQVLQLNPEEHKIPFNKAEKSEELQ